MTGRPAPPSIQVFGRDDSRPTRAALRFFRERRVAVSYVDLRRRPIARAELQRFVERLGAGALIDRDGRAYRDAGLAYLRMDAEAMTERVLADQRLLRLPLVRRAESVTAGPAASAWREWLRGA